MALSNIGREPRREITESAVGLAAFGLFVWADYEFAIWFEGATRGFPVEAAGGCPWPIGMFFGLIAAMLAFLALFVTHALGEGICNALQRNGIHLRPRVRK
jgi:hypothetical protein